MSCLKYLEDGDNYKKFAEYLAYCFALENILFMEKVSILYQIVLDLKEKNGTSRDRTLSLSPKYSSNTSKKMYEMKSSSTSSIKQNNKLIRNKFEYSVEIYFEIHKKIDKFNEKYGKNAEMLGTIGSIGYYKKILYKLYRDIYREFVKIGSKYEINISAEIRNELIYLFDDTKNIEKFETFDDFLYIYDKALIQVYAMLFSIYNYQFKQILKNSK